MYQRKMLKSDQVCSVCVHVKVVFVILQDEREHDD